MFVCLFVHLYCYVISLYQIVKGKIHGSMDVSLAVMSINKKSKRIDLDAGHSIYHMKVRQQLATDVCETMSNSCHTSLERL